MWSLAFFNESQFSVVSSQLHYEGLSGSSLNLDSVEPGRISLQHTNNKSRSDWLQNDAKTDSQNVSLCSNLRSDRLHVAINPGALLGVLETAGPLWKLKEHT